MLKRERCAALIAARGGHNVILFCSVKVHMLNNQASLRALLTHLQINDKLFLKNVNETVHQQNANDCETIYNHEWHNNVSNK